MGAQFWPMSDARDVSGEGIIKVAAENMLFRLSTRLSLWDSHLKTLSARDRELHASCRKDLKRLETDFQLVISCADHGMWAGYTHKLLQLFDKVDKIGM